MEKQIDYSSVIEYIDSYQGDFDKEMLSIFRDLAKKAVIDKFCTITGENKKKDEDIMPKILKGIESGNFVKGIITTVFGGKYKIPFCQATLENSEKVLFIFANSNTTQGKVGDEVEFYATRKNGNWYTIYGRIPKENL